VLDQVLLTVEEVAATMRVSKMTVYRLIHAGELESLRVGRSFRVPEPAFRAYMHGCTTAPEQNGEPLGR
jgi:excisionase family DNA binding protein